MPNWDRTLQRRRVRVSLFSVFVCSPFADANSWWNELGAAQLADRAVQMEDVVMLGKFSVYVG